MDLERDSQPQLSEGDDDDEEEGMAESIKLSITARWLVEDLWIRKRFAVPLVRQLEGVASKN